MRYSRTVFGLGLVSLAFCTGVAHAQTWTYDFSGNFANNFSPLIQAGGTVVQSNGELQFSATALADITIEDSTDQIFIFTPFIPTYSQSWSARVDMKVPTSLDATLNPDWYLGGGVGVFSVATDGTIYVAFNGLEIGNDQIPAGRKFNPEVNVDEDEVGDGEGVLITTAESVTLTLSFDAAAHTLTFGNLAGPLRVVDTSPSNLQTGDLMEIFIGFSGAATPPGFGVPQDTPLTLDNFSLTTPVPEPNIYLFLIAGLVLIGWTLKSRNRIALRAKAFPSAG